MATKVDIRESDRWFKNTDYTIKFRIYERDGVTPRNASGFTMSWLLKRRLADADVDATLTKTTPTITVVGAFNIDPDVNTQEVHVPIADDDTDGSVKAGSYLHELKRTDAGLETVLCFGSAVLRGSAHIS